MTTPVSNAGYVISNAISSTEVFLNHYDTRNPTPQDVNFLVGKRWLNTAESPILEYILLGFVASQGFLTANWAQLGESTAEIDTITGNSGGPVSPDANGNVNLVGDGTSLLIAGNPGTNTLTASLVGGSEAIDSFQPDSGTNPVIPTGAGLVTMAGSGSTTTVGGTNTLTTQLTGLTNHAVLVGAGTTTITKVGPSSTVGSPLISGGASADPSYSSIFSINDASGDVTVISAQGGVSQGIQFLLLNTSISGTGGVAGFAIQTTDTISGANPFLLYQRLGAPGFIITTGIDSSGNFNVINTGDIVAWSNTLFRIAPSGNITIGLNSTNALRLNNTTQTTVGAAGGASALPALPLGYLTININGTPVAIPYYTPV